MAYGFNNDKSKVEIYSKTEVDSEIDNVNDRIDNIITSPAPTEQEIIDARLGADGVTYPSLGDAIRDQVSDLKSDINRIEDDYYEITTETSVVDDEPTWTSGLMNPNGNVSANSSYHYSSKISVSAGDSIKIEATDSNYDVRLTNVGAARVCAYSNNTAVEAKGSSSPSKPFIVPDGIDEIVITLYAQYVDVVVHVSTAETIYTPNISVLYEEQTKAVVERVTPTVVPNKFVSKTGNESSSSSYYYFKIDVKEGDVIQNIRTKYNNGTSIVRGEMRFVCAYKNGIADSSLGAESVYTYTVPSGVTQLAISISSSYPLDSYVCILRSGEVTSITPNTQVESECFGKYPQSVSGDMAVSSKLEMRANSVKKNKEYLFNGKITSFNKISIGQGTLGDINTEIIDIDGTNITIYRATDTSGLAVPHGLTFADYISVSIKVDNSHIGHITIMTNGGIFTYDTTSIWIGCNPNMFVETDASTALTDCVFTFICNDTASPLWIFGDSYVSYFDDRWTYYISQLGFNDYLLNGYSGEPSAYAIKDLNNLLNYGTPKYIVWALGMNDADGGSSINSMWKSVYDEVVALCNENGITLIPCTIPNVPTRSHTYKNAEVVSSGYDYINFADAVGALNDTTWYVGMLSNDGVHPTEDGGRALASAVLKDFPYICIK